MKIGAIAPWLGSKRTMAEAIIDELGPHAAYFEPFGGGLSVLLAKPRSQQEGDLINLARVVQEVGMAEQLYERLSRVLFTEDLLDGVIVARAIVQRIEPPGKSKCDCTGRFKRGHKVMWTSESFFDLREGPQ